jgi:tetratricopeptide (TPR) repeat protein
VGHGTFQVEYVEDGEPSPAKSRLQLSVRILNLRELSQSPEETVATPVEELAAAQSRLAWQVLSRIAGPGRAPSWEAFLRSYPPVRLDALESYIRGLMAANAEQKHRLFTQAARLDERFSQPCFQLGRLQYAAKNYRAAAGWFERVPRGALRYLEAAYYLALCRYQLGEYDNAIRLLEEVAAALPLNEVWNNLGAAQSRRNLPAAVDSFLKAHEGDPNDPVYLFNLGYALWKNRRYDEAAEKFRASLDRNPQDPQAILMLGRSLAQTPPKESDLKAAGLERIKDNFEELAYRQLRATLERPANR